MSEITELLEQILSAVKGSEVRDSIHDAIEKCYEDGRAGTVDLQARGLIESAIQTNNDQESDINDLFGRVAELEGSSGGESSTETTTISLDTCKVQFGTYSTNISAKSVLYVDRTFSEEFDEVPFVGVIRAVTSSANADHTNVGIGVVTNYTSTTGFRYYVANDTNYTVSGVKVVWFAILPKTETVNIDVTIPAGDDLTEEQIQSIEDLFE